MNALRLFALTTPVLLFVALPHGGETRRGAAPPFPTVYALRCTAPPDSLASTVPLSDAERAAALAAAVTAWKAARVAEESCPRVPERCDH